jgi:hypothetical protein
MEVATGDVKLKCPEQNSLVAVDHPPVDEAPIAGSVARRKLT